MLQQREMVGNHNQSIQVKDDAANKARFEIIHNEWLNNPHTKLVLSKLRLTRNLRIIKLENLQETQTDKQLSQGIAYTKAVRDIVEIIGNYENFIDTGSN